MSEKLSRIDVMNLITQYSGQGNMIVTPVIFIKITGNFERATFLNQLLYWQDKMKGDWLFKTYKEWYEEIYLSEYQIRKASKWFEKEGILEMKIKKARGNPTVHYRLDKEKFLEWLLKNSRNEKEKFKKHSFKIQESLIENTIENTIENSNISKDILHGDLKQSPKINLNYQIDLSKEKTINTFNTKNELIEYWNNLKNVRKHRLSSKTYKKIDSLIKQLKNGTFLKKHNINQEFIKNNNISKEILNKKWKDEEIKEILNRLALLHQEGYWPHDKKIIKKGLDILIYNNRSGYSFFFKVAIHLPEPFENQIKPKNNKIFEKYKEIFKEYANNQKELKSLTYMFNDLYDEIFSIQNKIGKYMMGGFSSWFGSKDDFEPFFNQHIAWLKRMNKLHPSFLKLDSFNWKNFIMWVKQYYSYNLYPDKNQLKDLKWNYDKFLKEIERKKNNLINKQEEEYYE